jgi:hypothetical protein
VTHLKPINVQDEIVIESAAPAIWNTLTDISSWARWTRLIKHAAAYGPIKDGTEFKFIARRWDFKGTIEAAEEERLFICRAGSIGLTLVATWKLEAIENAFRVTFSIGASGWMVWLFGGRISRSLEDIVFGWLYDLKRHCERGVAEGEVRRPAGRLTRHPRLTISHENPLTSVFRPVSRRKDEPDK